MCEQGWLSAGLHLSLGLDFWWIALCPLRGLLVMCEMLHGAESGDTTARAFRNGKLASFSTVALRGSSWSCTLPRNPSQFCFM